MPTIITAGAASAKGFGFGAGGAKITYINNATTLFTTGDTSYTVTKPSNVSAGNLLVAFICHRDTNWDRKFTSIPSGWTLGTGAPSQNSATGSLLAYYKVATSSEPSDYTWSGALDLRTGTAIILNYSVAAWDTGSKGQKYQVTPPITLTPDPSSLTIAKSGSVVFYVAASEDPNKTINAPSGYSTLVSQLGGSSQGGAMWVFYKEDVAAGNSGSPTTTISTTGQAYVIMAAINPA